MLGIPGTTEGRVGVGAGEREGGRRGLRDVVVVVRVACWEVAAEEGSACCAGGGGGAGVVAACR